MLFDYSLVFFYLGIEDVSQEEWICRYNAISLFDNAMRIKMFQDLGSVEHVKTFQERVQELRQILETCAFFGSTAIREEVLSGESWCLLEHDEILRRMNAFNEPKRGLRRIIASYGTALPASYIKSDPGNVGRGVENDREKSYLIITLVDCASTINQATMQMQQAFAGLTAFEGGKFEWMALRTLASIRRVSQFYR